MLPHAMARHLSSLTVCGSCDASRFRVRSAPLSCSPALYCTLFDETHDTSATTTSLFVYFCFVFVPSRRLFCIYSVLVILIYFSRTNDSVGVVLCETQPVRFPCCPQLLFALIYLLLHVHHSRSAQLSTRHGARACSFSLPFNILYIVVLDSVVGTQLETLSSKLAKLFSYLGFFFKRHLTTLNKIY